MSDRVIPTQWMKTDLDNVLLSIVGGGTPSKANPSYYQGDIPWMSVKDMNKNVLEDTVDHISQEAVENSSTNVIPAGVPIIATRMSLGKIVVANFDTAINQDLKALFLPKQIDRNYLIWWYRSIAKDIENLGTGTTVKGVRLEVLRELQFPMAPLAEQQVIADKLDTLLAQVESIKARLERIPEILKQFRQSVLAAAVSGKLTEEWRRINTNHVKQDVYSIDKYWENEYKKNNKKYKKIEYPKSDFDLSAFPDSWVKTNVGRIFDVYVGATPSRQREDFWNGEINWVSSSEVAFCRIQSTKENITDEGYKSTSTTIHPIGTVMLAMIGQGKTRGQAAILDIEACHNQNTAALRIPEKIAKSEFLYFYLLYKYEETRQVGSGNNQQAMNKAIVQGIEFPLPPFKEQIEIVDKIESLFEYIERVEGQVQVALDRVNNLTQSILAKAFRGELTAEWRAANPDLISGDNSAEALLKQIKTEREAAKSATKRGRGKA